MQSHVQEERYLIQKKKRVPEIQTFYLLLEEAQQHPCKSTAQSSSPPHSVDLIRIR